MEHGTPRASNEIIVHEVGDRFATITREARCVIWEVDEHGVPQIAFSTRINPEERQTK